MEKKTQIVEATLTLMKQKGFESLRVNEIAEKSGISKRTLYRYFPSKKELISFIVSERHTSIQNRIVEILNAEGNETDKYDMLLTFVTKEIADETINLFEYLKKYPDLYEEIKLKQQQMTGNLEKILESGIEKNEIKNDFQPKIVAFLLVKMANIIFDPEFFMHNKVTFDEVTDNLKNMVLNGIRKENGGKG